MPYIPTMPKNRILPAICVATLIPLLATAQTLSPPPAANAPTSAPIEPPTDADKQVDAAIQQVGALKSVSADLVQKVDMLDQKFEIQGRYLKAPDRRVYLRLKVVGLADTDGTILQICDGQTLWHYQKILDTQEYRRFDVAKVFEKLSSPDLDRAQREPIIAQLGFAGPEELLSGLRKAVKFDQKEAGTLDGRDVWIVRGEWRNRNALTPKQQPLPQTAALPAYIPSLVVLYLGKDDGWPYKLTLVGRTPTRLLDARKNAAEARRAAAQDVSPTRIELIYSSVKLNADLKLDEFAFQPPPGARVEDSTQQIVNGLEQLIQYQAAQKKAEAAKSEIPTLNEKLDLPTRDGSAPPTLPSTLPQTKPGAAPK